MRKLLLNKEMNRCMKVYSPFIVTCFWLFLAVSTTKAQTCTGLTGIINTYAPVTNIVGSVVTRGTIAAGGSTTAFSVGDYVVLIQMTGIPEPKGGKIGKFELRRISAVSGSNITLDMPPGSYDFGTEKVQIIRTPHCPTATVTGDVKPMAWNGTTGGVLALKGGTLTLNANIDASNTGFTPTLVPTNTVTSNTTGNGSTVGRGNDGQSGNAAGDGGGGLSGGGGIAGNGVLLNTNDASDGGGKGSGYGGVNGDDRTSRNIYYGGGGGGGGGGIIGGGGGGSAATTLTQSGGGGGGIAGGGSGAMANISNANTGGGGGGGTHSVGNGGNSMAPDSPSAGGGGSYGGGGGGAGAELGGDDSSGGGGGGSWTGGGAGGLRGSIGGSYGNGGSGNVAVTTQNITTSDYFLNTTNPRLMMGGAGGNTPCQTGGIGGGIIILEFNSVSGNGYKITSNGQSLPQVTVPCSAINILSLNFGAGGAGGGAGGQMMLNVLSFTSTTTVEVKGGRGGQGNANTIPGALYHAGNGGGGGGGGGIWVYSSGSNATNTGAQTVTIANTNIIGVGAGASSLSVAGGGTAGFQSINPKNSYSTSQGGTGGNGLIATGATLVWPCIPFSVTTSSDITECLGGTLSFTASISGGTSPFTYQWQNGGTAGTTWTNIVGATSATYTPLSTTAGTTFYRVRVASSTGTSCDTSYSNPRVATIVNDPSVSVSTLPATVCVGANVTLTATPTVNTGSCSIQWQSSPNGITWTNITGATSGTYTVTNLNATTRYRAQLVSCTGNGCCN